MRYFCRLFLVLMTIFPVPMNIYSIVLMKVKNEFSKNRVDVQVIFFRI